MNINQNKHVMRVALYTSLSLTNIEAVSAFRDWSCCFSCDDYEESKTSKKSTYQYVKLNDKEKNSNYEKSSKGFASLAKELKECKEKEVNEINAINNKFIDFSSKLSDRGIDQINIEKEEKDLLKNIQNKIFDFLKKN